MNAPMPRIPSLVEQIALAFVPPVSQKKRFNPRPAGVIRHGSSNHLVLTFLLESPGFKTEAQIRWHTGLPHSKVSWACLYLRRNGLVEALPDHARCARYCKYRATDAGRNFTNVAKGSYEHE